MIHSKRFNHHTSPHKTPKNPPHFCLSCGFSHFTPVQKQKPWAASQILQNEWIVSFMSSCGLKIKAFWWESAVGKLNVFELIITVYFVSDIMNPCRRASPDACPKSNNQSAVGFRFVFSMWKNVLNFDRTLSIFLN